MSNNERRQFNRVAFEATASLTSKSDSVSCEIVDLSLHGALVNGSNEQTIDPSLDYVLKFTLSEQGEQIEMPVKLAHQDGKSLGLECLQIDLDSITHLRRLLELNLGSSELVERDFEALCKDNLAES